MVKDPQVNLRKTKLYETKEEARPRCIAIHALSSSKFDDFIKTLSWEEIHKDPCLLVSIEGRKICVGIRKEMWKL